MSTASNDTQVIQCPSCQTKFAVQGSLIAGTSFPRFHCSRCDHVFSIEQQMTMPLSTVADPMREAAAVDATEESDAQFDDWSTDDAGPSDLSGWLLGNDSPSNVPNESSESFKQFESSAPVAQDTVQSEEFESPFAREDHAEFKTDDYPETSEPLDLYQSRPEMPADVEIPALEDILNDISEEDSPTIEDLQGLALNQMSTAKTTEMPASVREEALNQMDMVLNPRAMRPKREPLAPLESPTTFESKQDSAATPQEDTTPPLEPRPVISKKAKKKEKSGASVWKTSAPVEETLTAEKFNRETAQTARAAGRRISRWKSVATVSAPLIAFLGLLICAGFLLSQNPQDAWALSNTITGSTTRVAPADLLMTKISHKEVELETGELIHVIEGTLQNKTADTFSAITLEAFTFNASGKVLNQITVPINSSLGRTRVQSLSLEMIENLQRTERHSRFALKPDEEFDFTIALVDENSSPVSYYSARVYSVR